MTIKEIKGIYVGTDGTIETRTIPKSETHFEQNQHIYQMLDIECLEIVSKSFGRQKRRFTIICDDEGALKENPIPTVFGQCNRNVQIFGNCFICSNDGPELESLTIEEAGYIVCECVGCVGEFAEDCYPMNMRLILKDVF